MKIYAYDFDKTIYDGDSSVDFIIFLIKKNKKLIFKFPKIFIKAIKYKLKIIDLKEFKESVFELLKYFDNIDLLIEEFWNINENKIKKFFKDKKNHKNDIIASASPYFLLEPIAKKYKIKDLFASPIDKKNGKFLGNNCKSKEKLKLIKSKYPNAIIQEMYSDDATADKPLLDIAKCAYIIRKNEIINYEDYLKIKPNIFKRFWNWGWGIYHKNEEIWNYLIVGFLTTLVSLIIYYGLVILVLNPENPIELQAANIISWIVSVMFAYVTNRKFVFKSKEKNKVKESMKFIGSRIITLVMDMLIMFIGVTVLNQNDKVTKIVSQILVIVGNYIISKLYVFKKNINKSI